MSRSYYQLRIYTVAIIYTKKGPSRNFISGNNGNYSIVLSNRAGESTDKLVLNNSNGHPFQLPTICKQSVIRNPRLEIVV